VTQQLLDTLAYLSVLFHGAVLAAQATTVGGVAFAIFVARQTVLSSCRRLILWSASTLFVAQLALVVIKTISLMNSAELSLAEVAGAEFFVAGAVTLLAAALIIALTAGWWPRSIPLLAIASLGVIAASVMTTHSAARVEHRLPLAIATTFHLLATATWIGGLPYLISALTQTDDSDEARRLALRFSTLALVSVSLLFVAGSILAIVYVGSPSGGYGTAYGIMVGVKIALFLGLLLLGASNFLLIRRLRPGARLPSISRLRHFAEAEIGIGITVILAAASLTTTPPAVDVPADRVQPAEIVERMEPRWPRLRSPNLNDLTMPTMPAAPGEITPLTPHPSNDADIGWSEYNHHWSGMIVLLAGLLAIAWRAGTKWAVHWPLVLIGLALLMILRADPENWPLGPKGFWISLTDAEVLQHRFFAVLVIGLALFEWSVRTGRLASRWAAMVFPLLCAIGGALLLTHSHAVGNVKQELLIEMTHSPLGLLGITLGWTRWIEVREGTNGNRIVSWIWPVCLVLVGILLIFYREA